MKNLKVSIISPYMGTPHSEFVKSVKAQTYKNIELLLITEEGKKRRGAGAMRNQAAKKANGNILFFVDSDTRLMKDCIKNLVKIFKDEEIDAISGLPITPPLKSSSSLIDFLLGLDYEDRIRKMKEGYVNVAATTCFGIKKSIFRKMGGFITKFKRGTGEDWDFSERLSKKEYKIWHSNKVRLYHFTATTLTNYLEKQYHHAKYRIEHFFKFKTTRDEYTTFKTLMQPSLFLLLPITFLNIWLLPILFMLIILWDIPLVIKSFKRTNNIVVILLLPLTALRSLIWIIGAIAGLIEKIIISALKDKRLHKTKSAQK